MLLANAKAESNHQLWALDTAAPLRQPSSVLLHPLPNTSNSLYMSLSRQRSAIAIVLLRLQVAIQAIFFTNSVTTRTYQCRTLTPVQLADLKSGSECRGCGQLEDWAGDHKSDGSYKSGAKSYLKKTTSARDGSGSPKRLKLKKAKFSRLSLIFLHFMVPYWVMVLLTVALVQRISRYTNCLLLLIGLVIKIHYLTMSRTGKFGNMAMEITLVNPKKFSVRCYWPIKPTMGL